MKIVISVWLILTIINIIYKIFIKKYYLVIDNETNGLEEMGVSKNFVIIIFLVMTTVTAPFIFIFETLPGILKDIKLKFVKHEN